MPIPNFETFCFGIVINTQGICVHYPGGAPICAFIPDIIPPDPLEWSLDLFGKLNSALAPLNPMFNMLDVMLAVVDALKAIATLDAAKIIGVIPNLAERVNKLLTLIPQLCLPLLIRDCIDVLILYLRGLQTYIERLLSFYARLVEAQLRASESEFLLGPIIDCATGNLDTIILHVGAQAQPINRILGIINEFLLLMELPCIPPLSIPSLSIGFVGVLEALIQFLIFLRNLLNFTIPIPSVEADVQDC